MIAGVADETASPEVVLYHNKSCSNSRGALAWLQDNGKAFRTIEYLKEPLDRARLVSLVGRLEDDPAELVRHDKRFAELGLDPDGYKDAEAVVDLLVEHPELMQRPVIDDGTRAVIGRPPQERLPEFFG